MKVRKGFVSNSSSSSFIISKKVLSEEQIDKIKNHIKYAQDNFPQISWADREGEWYVDETDEQVLLNTCMDNFDMHEFLLLIGVAENSIEYRDF